MLLGGLRYLLPVIEAAHQQGYYVITADYLPDNIAHKYSDEYCNVSVTDKEAVLEAAKRLKIDGIMSFAVDPGVVAASYVQNELRLPSFGPYESVCILQNKDRFRAFLTENGFNVPKAKGFGSREEVEENKYWIPYPCIVKPTDSAGSKGVTRVDCYEELKQALEHAFTNSITGRIIIEEFIEKDIPSSDCDCFSVNGQLVYTTFSAQHFDEKAAGAYVPAAFSWPSAMSKQHEEELTSELQRLLSLLSMNTSIYNVETRVGNNGKPYIMEVSPRGGGNRLAEMIRLITGVDMISACVRAAVGEDPKLFKSDTVITGHWAEIVLHAIKDGKFSGIKVSPEMEKHIVEIEIRVEKGSDIHAFRGANDAIGTLVMKFDSEEEIKRAINTQDEWVSVLIQD